MKLADQVMQKLADGRWHTLRDCDVTNDDLRPTASVGQLLVRGVVIRDKAYRMMRSGRPGLVVVLRRTDVPEASQ